MESSLGISSIPRDREVLLLGSLTMAPSWRMSSPGAWPSAAKSLTLGFIGEDRTDGPVRVPSPRLLFAILVLTDTELRRLKRLSV